MLNTSTKFQAAFYIYCKTLICFISKQMFPYSYVPSILLMVRHASPEEMNQVKLDVHGFFITLTKVFDTVLGQVMII